MQYPCKQEYLDYLVHDCAKFKGFRNKAIEDFNMFVEKGKNGCKL